MIGLLTAAAVAAPMPDLQVETRLAPVGLTSSTEGSPAQARAGAPPVGLVLTVPLVRPASGVGALALVAGATADRVGWSGGVPPVDQRSARLGVTALALRDAYAETAQVVRPFWSFSGGGELAVTDPQRDPALVLPAPWFTFGGGWVLGTGPVRAFFEGSAFLVARFDTFAYASVHGDRVTVLEVRTGSTGLALSIGAGFR